MKNTILSHNVYSISKSKTDEIRLTLKSSNGKRYIDLRIWFLPDNSKEFFPTKQGLFFPIELLDEILNGLKQLQASAQAFPEELRAQK